MRTARLTRTAAFIGLALLATACGEQARSTADQIADETRKGITEATAPGGTVDKALAEARRKLHEENLKLQHDGIGAKAELTPQGDLLINGTAIAMTAEQREAALAYRKEVLAVAEAGMVIGQQGAALGGEAAALAIESLFKGGSNVDEAKARIEAEAEKIKSAAAALCANVEGLEAAQARFSELVPEFAPYAKSIDIDAHCDAPEAPIGPAAPEAPEPPAASTRNSADTVST